MYCVFLDLNQVIITFYKILYYNVRYVYLSIFAALKQKNITL